MRTLVTISFSHYCEKARWALDLVGDPYREQAHLPLFHFLPVALATRGAVDKRGDAVSTRLSTPVLICEDGTRICDSTRIMQYLSRTHGLGLYDHPTSLELDAKYSEELGPHSRRYGYHHLLDKGSLMREFFARVASPEQAAMAAAIQPLYARVMRRALRINPASAERSKTRILAMADDVEQRLSDGRRYLCGDRLSGADVSFAALMAPALLITRSEGYGSEFPSMAEVGGELAEFAGTMRKRRAGRYVLEMYRRHRGVSSQS